MCQAFAVSSVKQRIPDSEFTKLVSRNKLSHPPSELYDLSLYVYCFFKARSNKCCTKIFLEAYEFIYESTGYSLLNINSILRRFNNCFFKAYASSETSKITVVKDKKQRIKRKLSSLHKAKFDKNLLFIRTKRLHIHPTTSISIALIIESKAELFFKLFSNITLIK